ncbi:hypothetical protein H257_11910 [Aphanomyces astaci]|uniref:Uncharacterized protein n=1 Tax=Aphanomyces astaci TaxID=112090 RepID=W4G083_APHAT|nr:hypothetical protein H257_11910 [Aphanomyces astaci]ETV73085.1 hypothetical protein H257_11910 [Aphanomyces astaci]|eukprot:XP_009837290.1 hypothetical protein H257_11910 [Aphanomyces astaci]
MALYESLESDVASFFVAQGSLIESLVHSLCLRVATIEAKGQAQSCGSPDLSHVAAMIDTSAQQCLAYVDEKVATLHYKLEGMDAEFDRINRALETMFQSLGQLKHHQLEAQRQYDAAVDDMTRQCRDLHAHVKAVQTTVPDMGELEIVWRDRVLCGLTQEQLLGLAKDLTDLSHVSECHVMALATRHAIQQILDAKAGGSAPPLGAMMDLERGLDALPALVQATASNPETTTGLEVLAHAMTMLPGYSNLVKWGVWSSMHSSMGHQSAQLIEQSLATMGLTHEVLRSQVEHVQNELERHAYLEHQLEMQLAACPRQEEMLDQLSQLQAKLQNDLSTDAALASMEELRSAFQRLPNSDVIQSIVRTLETKADKSEMRRLEQNQQTDDVIHLGLTKASLKCLSCDQYLPKHYHYATTTTESCGGLKPPPLVSPRQTLKPLDPAKRCTQPRPKSSHLHGASKPAPVHFVQDIAAKLGATVDAKRDREKALPKHQIQHHSHPSLATSATTSHSTMPRTVTLAFQFPAVPPIATGPEPLSDKKKYSFYSATDTYIAPNQ